MEIKSAYRRKFLDFFVVGSQRGKAYVLGKLCKRRVGQDRGMTQQLVNAVRFWRVVRIRGMPNILSGLENSIGKTGEKVSRGQQPSGGPQSESRPS